MFVAQFYDMTLNLFEMNDSLAHEGIVTRLDSGSFHGLMTSFHIGYSAWAAPILDHDIHLHFTSE